MSNQTKESGLTDKVTGPCLLELGRLRVEFEPSNDSSVYRYSVKRKVVFVPPGTTVEILEENDEDSTDCPNQVRDGLSAR